MTNSAQQETDRKILNPMSYVLSPRAAGGRV